MGVVSAFDVGLRADIEEALRTTPEDDARAVRRDWARAFDAIEEAARSVAQDHRGWDELAKHLKEAAAEKSTATTAGSRPPRRVAEK
jgi:hypothetical protein